MHVNGNSWMDLQETLRWVRRLFAFPVNSDFYNQDFIDLHNDLPNQSSTFKLIEVCEENNHDEENIPHMQLNLTPVGSG